MDAVDQFAAISRQLKEMADKGLQREFSKAINSAVKPLKADLQKSALEKLPKKGGLNQRVANGTRISTRRANSRRAQGIRVQAKNAYALGRIDGGTVRHPVFGHRDRWVDQHVTPGWWSDPIEAAGPNVQREIQAAMDRIARKIEGAK